MLYVFKVKNVFTMYANLSTVLATIVIICVELNATCHGVRNENNLKTSTYGGIMVIRLGQRYLKL